MNLPEAVRGFDDEKKDRHIRMNADAVILYLSRNSMHRQLMFTRGH